MGFITYFGNNSEYSSRTPVALTYECEPSKKYLIDPVRYTIDRLPVLNEVTENENDKLIMVGIVPKNDGSGHSLCRRTVDFGRTNHFLRKNF